MKWAKIRFIRTWCFHCKLTKSKTTKCIQWGTNYSKHAPGISRVSYSDSSNVKRSINTFTLLGASHTFVKYSKQCTHYISQFTHRTLHSMAWHCKYNSAHVLFCTRLATGNSVIGAWVVVVVVVVLREEFRLVALTSKYSNRRLLVCCRWFDGTLSVVADVWGRLAVTVLHDSSSNKPALRITWNRIWKWELNILIRHTVFHHNIGF